MSHSNTQRLTDYWRARRGVLRAPLRSNVDPSDFADLLPQVFMLGRLGAGHYSFRLAGGLLTDLHGQELRKADFSSLWVQFDRAQLNSAMENALRRSHVLVIEADGATAQGGVAAFEILLAPLVSKNGFDRFLGLYQPTSPLSRLDDRPVSRLSIKLIRALAGAPDMADQTVPQLRLAAVDGRRIAS